MVIPAVKATLQAVTLQRQANGALVNEWERMARRRFQQPTPEAIGNWWYIRIWEDAFDQAGNYQRRRKRVKLGFLGSMKEKEARRAAEQYLLPLNQGLEGVGSALNFAGYCERYKAVALPKMAATTQGRYKQVIRDYLMPAFGRLALKDVTPERIDTYFAGFAGGGLMQESVEKIRTVLASIFHQAVRHRLILTNPVKDIELPRLKQSAREKPYLTPEQFDELVRAVSEPYATMIYVAIYSGLRVSELVGLKWNDLSPEGIRVDERYCRGDWDRPKSEASNATVAVPRAVIERIYRLKLLTAQVKAGRAVRKYKLVKRDGPEDLVFQSVKDGLPMRDNNILTRFLKPAARKLGLGFVNWRCLRTSHATWLKLAGADVKDAQAQMRHSRVTTTLEIYEQFVPESQRKAVQRMGRFDPGAQMALGVPLGKAN